MRNDKKKQDAKKKNSEHPETKIINEQKAIRVDSPLENWPGCIYVPAELSPEQFDKWWKNDNTPNDDIPPERKLFRDRYHLVLEWHIEGLKAHHVEPSGDKLPSMRIAGFIVSATTPIISEARSYPNLPGWWSWSTEDQAKHLLEQMTGEAGSQKE